jgi:RHS repeat-associated protein
MTVFADPDGNESRLAYDAVGRLTGVAYPNGVTETRAYDAAGSLAELAVGGPEGLLESYVYARDARGFATTQVEEDGATTTWAYDDAGRLVRVDYPAAEIQAIRDEQGATIERVRPTTEAEENPEGEGATDPTGSHGSGDSTGALGGVTCLADLACAGPVLLAGGQGQGNGQGNGGGQDNGGNSGGQGNGNGTGEGRGDTPSIEAADTTEAIVPAYTLPVREWVEYQYDAAGNRVRETSDLGATNYAYDAANRLLEAGEVSLAYDVAGRLTRRLAGDEAVTYGYDVVGRLREVAYADGTGVAYGYDALGRKVSREATFWSVADPKRRGPSENGLEHGNGFEQGQHNGWLTRPRLETESTTYLWDGLRVLAEYTDKGAPLAEYYTAGDRVLARKMFGYHGRKELGAPDLQTNGGLLYYNYDGLGNVSLLTDRLGEPEASYRYDAFGGLLTSATAPYNLYGPFGKEFDPASGLIYFGARWYDASVGRFTTPDPVAGALRDPLTLNPYLFAKANPVNFVDRWGLHAEEPASTYTHDVTADYREVTATTWLASVEVSYTSEVSRSPREVVLHHVYRHRHWYQRIELRSERRVRADGYEYWELVKDIEYTYWKTIESSDEWETIDLIGPKRQDLVEAAGEAPGSWEPAWEESMALGVFVNAAFFSEDWAEAASMTGRGASKTSSYAAESPAAVQRYEQQEVLAPEIPYVADKEAFEALYELASFVSKTATVVIVFCIVAGTGGLAGAGALIGPVGTTGLWASVTAEIALWREGVEVGNWEEVRDRMAIGAFAQVLGSYAAVLYAGGLISEAMALWLVSLGIDLSSTRSEATPESLRIHGSEP